MSVGLTAAVSFCLYGAYKGVDNFGKQIYSISIKMSDKFQMYKNQKDFPAAPRSVRGGYGRKVLSHGKRRSDTQNSAQQSG